MITRYYLRDVNTGMYYFLFHGAEGFIPKEDIDDAYVFCSRNDAIAFMNREEESELFEGKVIEIVELFCF